MNTNTTKRLMESAVMLAVATVLSMIKLVDLPAGGSVTIASMLPVLIIAYRYGLKWGLLTGFVYGIIQQLLGLHTLSYVTTFWSILAVILLDYAIAFMVIGFGGVFRKMASQPVALVLGAVLVSLLRYICHVISGATVWAGLSIPDNAALAYSFSYNATYMIPEGIVTALLAYYIGSALDFRREDIARLSLKKEAGNPILLLLAGLPIIAALVYDTVAVFGKLQNADSGEFDITSLSLVNWPVVAIVSAAGIALAALLFVLSRRRAARA